LFNRPQNQLRNPSRLSHHSRALGVSAGLSLTTGSNNIDIGNFGVAGESNTIRIGTVGTQTAAAAFIAGIHGATVASGVGVIVDSNGHLGTIVSSKRFKDEIKPNGVGGLGYRGLGLLQKYWVIHRQ